MVAFYKICRHKHGYNHTSDAVGVRLLSTAEEARLRVEADDNNDDNKNVSVDMQRQGAGDMFKAAQWQLGCTEDESGCVEFNVGDYHRQSLTDDVLHSCCADCSGGCYDDEMSTFYVNYQHQGETVADAVDSTPKLTGVQVCGPASFELLFLIDQLASTACLVDDPGAFVTLIQTAAAVPSAASALYIDSSPRIVELCTDDELELITGNLTERAASIRHADDSRDDSEPLNKDADGTTPADATDGCGAVEDYSKTSTTSVDCPGKQSEITSDGRGKVRRRHKRSGPQEKEKPNDAENHVQSFESLRHPRLPDLRGNVGASQVNKDNELNTTTTTTRTSKRFGYRCNAAAGRHQRRRLPALDTRTSAVSKAVTTEETVGMTSEHSDTSSSCHQRQPQRRAAAEGQRNKYTLPDVFVDRKPLLPAVTRRFEPSLGRGLRLPAAGNSQRMAREAPRVFPPPPQRRRSHPLAPRRPRTPANRNVLASRAVWPSMASGRPVEDEWTRRAAVMRRRGRLPPLHQTESVATWN